MKHLNRRKRVMAGVALATAFLLAVFIGGSICSELAVATDFTQKNLPPGAGHLFGTDWMGRDMAGADVERTVFEHFSWNPGSRGQRMYCPDSGDCFRDTWKDCG